MKKIILLLIAALPLCGAASVTLPHFFTDSMVVQHDAVLTVPGETKKNATVKIMPSWCESIKVKADKQGKFTAKIASPPIGGPYSITFDDGQSLTLSDILSGDVWLCSGQSNMEMPVESWGKVMDYEHELAEANYPQLRLMKVKQSLSYVPNNNTEVNMGGWRSATAESIANFSAIGYFFGRDLMLNVDHPIGIIDSTWGGTPIEAWSAYGTLWGQNEFPDLLAEIDTCIEQGQAAWNPLTPTVLYNAMIHPLTIFPLKGVLWYQGCFNVGRDEQYARLFPAMIKDWRKEWGHADMPFYFVQLASYLQPKRFQPDSQWAALREAQKSALNLDNTAMAVAIDLGDPDDAHYKNKQEVAHRLLLIALNDLYDTPTTCSAPTVLQSEVNGRHVVLTFSGDVQLLGGGQAFIIQGPDGKWGEAYGRQIAPNAISVVSNDIDMPIEVRYDWADFPDGNLRGLTGLPVAPFRIKL